MKPLHPRGPAAPSDKFQRAVALHRRGDIAGARAAFQDILRRDPRHFDSLNLLGITHVQSRRFEDAAKCFAAAAAVNPQSLGVQLNWARALVELRRFDDALARTEAAMAIKPDHADCHFQRGMALLGLGRAAESLDCFDRVLALDALHVNALVNRGIVLIQLDDPVGAIASLRKAVVLKPGDAKAHYNLGNALFSIHQVDEALPSYRAAIASDPSYAQAHYNLGNALVLLNRPEEALASFERALALAPDSDFLGGVRLHTAMKLCDWTDFPQRLAAIEAELAAGRRVVAPFALLSLADDPLMHREASRIYARARFPSSAPAPAWRARAAGEKLRIGYYSADFHNHATSYLMAEVFESHDAARFEVYGFSFGPNPPDAMRSRVAPAFTAFIDVSTRSDGEVVRLSREIGIDIAVDLKGYTLGARTGLFARRCAPLQVSFLGYPGTMGADYFDYVIADKIVVPEPRQDDFTEKLVYLRRCYQPNDSQRPIAERPVSRHDAGLADAAFVYCSFNNNFKILPAVFDSWMRILDAVDGSVLWLLEDNPTAAANLRKEAQARGISGNRLVFAPRVPLEDHLARHGLANLFLDTLPYNAHTTASDALWAGLPVLTCAGTAFAGRVAASLLTALGLGELVAGNTADYESMAIAFAREPDRLRRVREQLELARRRSEVFDGRAFARDLEAAFSAMFARQAAGHAPVAIDLSAGER